MVEVRVGESFVVPPDYGHLQINPSDEPLVFSYLVMDGMKGQYEPYKKTQGAAFYEMEEGFVQNEKYDSSLELRIIKAGDICQMTELNENMTYQRIKKMLPDLKFITDPTIFPESAAL
jgi:glucose-6-phosphate isomerase